MNGPLDFPYYRGCEAEQYAFYRIPKLLISDDRFRAISTDAKLLYGLMLDRMSLSIKNGWIDNGRVGQQKGHWPDQACASRAGQTFHHLCQEFCRS